jgi:hypothetical protein
MCQPSWIILALKGGLQDLQLREMSGGRDFQTTGSGWGFTLSSFSHISLIKQADMYLVSCLLSVVEKKLP